MNGARLVLVPVSDVPCSWCGRRGEHDARCYLAHPNQFNKRYAPGVGATADPRASAIVVRVIQCGATRRDDGRARMGNKKGTGDVAGPFRVAVWRVTER